MSWKASPLCFVLGTTLWTVCFCAGVLSPAPGAVAQQVSAVLADGAPAPKPEGPVKEGGWLVTREENTGVSIRTMEMTLHPQTEPRPALKYRLVPDEFDMVEGNAAIYYLKAMGFLEQNAARDQLTDFTRESGKRAEGKDWSDVPPYNWQAMPPAELPLDKVKEYLQFTAFQPRFLREAARRPTMDLNRNIRGEQDPIAYLLPEIQSMRELARTQSLRCRVAIAEGRLDDAIEILGQQYAMSRHLVQDEFLVSNLVGIACGGLAWEDALYLVQQPQAPNLYWAFASLPPSMFELRPANAFERQFLYEQLKILRQVDETPRPAGYWQDFLDRLAAQFGTLGQELGLHAEFAQDPVALRAVLTGFVAASYPGAKRFLIEQCGLPPEKVAAYPTAQTVFLAVVRFYDQARDDEFKWNFLPYSQVEANPAGRQRNQQLRDAMNQIGWITAPTQLVLPAVSAARTAAVRSQQTVSLVQTVEAIRMYGAAHEGKLPPTLDALPVPAPMEPFTGAPLAYEFHGDWAVLTGHRVPGLQYRLVLRFAK
jgi:hypothetical protein